MSFVIGGGTVLTPDGRVDADLLIEDGHIAALEPGRTASPDLDATSCLVAPGFVGFQCNGAVGIDLASQPDRIADVSEALPRWGVTSWLPTIVTAPPGTIDRALDALAEHPTGPVARPLGLHLEGPFLADPRRGAHPPELLRDPSLADIDRWSPDHGVALVTLAPELPGAGDVIAALVDRGVIVSAGHTTATAEQALAAIDAGVTWVTHLFNAMEPLHHRAPGLVGVALADERLHAGVIADGIHLHPVTVAAAHRSLGPRLTLVTDAVGGLGLPPGDTPLGNARVVVHDDGSVRLPDGTLACSALSMDQAVRNLRDWSGCDPDQAIAAATSSPAAVLRRADIGSVAAGNPADLVVLDVGLQVVATVTRGEVAFSR